MKVFLRRLWYFGSAALECWNVLCSKLNWYLNFSEPQSPCWWVIDMDTLRWIRMDFCKTIADNSIDSVKVTKFECAWESIDANATLIKTILFSHHFDYNDKDNNRMSRMWTSLPLSLRSTGSTLDRGWIGIFIHVKLNEFFRVSFRVRNVCNSILHFASTTKMMTTSDEMNIFVVVVLLLCSAIYSSHLHVHAFIRNGINDFGRRSSSSSLLMLYHRSNNSANTCKWMLD